MYRRLRKVLFVTAFITVVIYLLRNGIIYREILDTNSNVNAVNIPYTWQNVSFSNKTYVFSAFAYNNIVTIVAVTDQYDMPRKFNCQFSDENKVNPQAKSCNGAIARPTFIHESHRMRYSAAFFKCPLPTSARPYYVSLSNDDCKTPSNVIPLLYPKQQQRYFTVCVGPLHNRYSKAYELVEMIELNRILGADHFVFYNYSTAYNVDMVLQYYKKKGLIDVFQWNVPLKVDTMDGKGKAEIHYFAQLALLNDCIYRNMYVSRYIVVQDLDEFIIPRNQLTWKHMLQKLPKRYGAYMFRCVFFRKEWPDTETTFNGKQYANMYKLNTLLKQKREPKYFPKKQRSKYIVDPMTVEMAGIHFIWHFKKNSSQYFVDPKIARLQHYRNLHNITNADTRIQDDRIMVYKDKLLYNTRRIWETLRDVPLGPI